MEQIRLEVLETQSRIKYESISLSLVQIQHFL